MSTNYDALFLQENIDEIDSVFEEKKEIAEETAKAEASKLSSSIEYYQNHSFEYIKRDIRMKATRRYMFITNEKALKRAIEKEYEERKQCVVPESVIEEIIKETSEEIKSKLIKQYRDELFNDYVTREDKKAEKSIEVFGVMSDQQKKDYVKDYKGMVLANELYDKRKEAILEVAKSLKIKEIPMCMEFPSLIQNEIKRVAKVDLQDKEDISFKERIIRGINTSDDKLHKNWKYVWLSFFTSLTASTIIGFSSINAGVSEPAAIGAFVGSLTLFLSTMGAFFHIPDLEDYLEDKKIIEEATKLGLYDCSKAWYEATEKFTSIDKAIKKENYTLDQGGGEHELRK